MGSSFSIRGIQNAAVFPVPVAACPIMFCFPFRRSGITLAWIGEGVSKPFFERAWRVFSVSPRSAKHKVVVVVIREKKYKIVFYRRKNGLSKPNLAKKSVVRRRMRFKHLSFEIVLSILFSYLITRAIQKKI